MTTSSGDLTDDGVGDSGHPDYAAQARVEQSKTPEAGDVDGSNKRDDHLQGVHEAIASGRAEAVEDAVRYGQFLLRQGDHAGARRAFALAAGSGHAEHAPAAALQLGKLLADSNDHDGARAAYQAAVDSRHPEHSPSGAVMLGLLVAGRGDLEGAQTAYEQAIGTGHPEHAPAGLCHLATTLAAQSDVHGACRAYERAIASGHPEYLPRSATSLGILLAAAGRDDESRRALMHAIESQHPEHAPEAALALGALLASGEDAGGALAAYRTAITSGHPRHGPAAALRMAELLREAGDLAGARRALAHVVESGHPDHAPAAAVQQACLLIEAGDSQAAQHALRLAVDSGHPVFGSAGALQLGLLLARGGDLDGARAAYEQAAELGQAGHGQEASFHLGQLLHEQGDVADACNAWRRVTDPGHPMYAAAASKLGSALHRLGDLKGAQAALACAAATSDREFAPAAAAELGTLLSTEKRDLPGGRKALKQAMASGHPEYSAYARITYAGMLVEGTNDLSAARGMLEQVVAEGHPGAAPLAELNLASILLAQGEEASARLAYQHVVDSGHSEHAATASERLRHLGALGELLEDQDDPEFGARAAFELGARLHDQGDHPGARRHLKRAIDSGHPEYSWHARNIYAAMLAQDSDLPAARAMLQRVVADGHPAASPLAALNLGNILAGTGDAEGAEIAYRVAVDSHHPKYAKSAAIELSRLTGEDVLAVVDGPDGPTRVLATTIGGLDDEVDEVPGPLVPVLVPADWNPSYADGATAGTQNYHFRPLLVAGHHVATVTFARLNRPFAPSLEPVRPDMDVTQIETAAVGSLRTAGLRWTPFTFGDDDDGAIDMNGVLECTPHDVAASGVLDERLLLDAHEQLGSARLVVAFPTQNSLVAAPADFPADRLVTLARLVAIWFVMSDEPVAHQMFYATNGVLSGIYEGSDQALAAVQDEFDDPASADAESAGLPDDSPWIDDGIRGPLLPLLKPLDWEQTIEHLREDGVEIVRTLARPLVLAGRPVGFVAFGREAAIGVGAIGMLLEKAGEGADLEHIEAEAMDNLRATELRWRRVDVVIPAIDDREVAGWTCLDNDFAGAAVLDPELLREAHRKADSHRLLVALPSREVLLAAVNDDDPQTVALFARAAALWYVNGDIPITHLTFLATDGTVDGVYEGSDRALREVEEFPVPARIMLATLGEPGEPPHPEGKLDESVWERFQELIDYGDPSIAETLLGLAEELAALGDLRGAARGYDMVLRAGHPENAGRAAAGLSEVAAALSEVLSRQGDTEGVCRADERDAGGALTEVPAEAWEDLERETAAGDDDAIAAATGIGRRLAEGGNHADAERAYRMAIATGHPEWAPEAAVSLGMLLQGTGDLDGARGAYEQGIEYLDDEAGQESAFWLGQLLDEQGDIEGACAAWLLVTEPQWPRYAGAAQNLGVALKQKGDREGAVLALRRAVESDDPDVSPGAALSLASVLWATDDRPGARAALQRAIDSGHLTHAPAAAEYLRIHFPELPGNPELSAADGPALPVLQPLDWVETLGGTQAEGVAFANALARPLTLAGQHVGYIAFSRDNSDHTQLESPGSLEADGAIPDEYEAAALMNLRVLGLEWRQLQIFPPDGEPFEVLSCTGHPLAAGAILDRSFLAQAQLILGCDRILVAIPNRDLLQVGRADLPGQQVAHFAGSVEAFHDSNDYPVSPLTFYATNGVVDGICDPPPLEYGPAEPAAHHPPPGIHVKVTTPVARPSDGAAPKSVQQPAAATSASTTSDSNTGELSTRQVTVSGPANRPTLTPEDVANVDERWAALRRAVEAGALHAERRALDFGVALVDQTDWVRAERVFEFLSRCRDPRTAIMASQNLQSVRGAMQWESQQR